MTAWIYDEDITKNTVISLGSTIKGVHIVYDLGYPKGLDDDTIIQVAQKNKKTLLTGNYRDFIN